jgi:preprotein translocase subunit SecG
MTVLLTIFHVLICVALVMIVLLQTGKGADMGATFGGGSSQTLFGSTGAASFLTKSTTFVAVAFMVTSLSLAYIASGTGKYESVIKNNAPIESQSDVETEPQTGVDSEASQAPVSD